MPAKVFISYHGLNKISAFQVKDLLEHDINDIEVVMYDPGLKWDDAPTTVVLEIETSDCVVYLDRRKKPSEWVKAELDWAEINQVPIFKIRYNSDLHSLIPQIMELRDKEKFKLPEGDRWYHMKRIFLKRVGEDEIGRSDEFATHATQYKQIQQSMNAGYGIGWLLKLVFGTLAISAMLVGLFLLLSCYLWNISIWWSIGTLMLIIPFFLLHRFGRKLIKASDEWDDKYLRNDDGNV